MQLSSVPYKFQYVWGQNATSGFVTDPIPATTTSPAASQSLGFPPATSIPIAAGGTPPNIDDFNGAYFYTTSWLQWLQAGGPVQYDATLQTNIGGYPKGAIVQSVANFGYQWLSEIDNNTSDPDTGGANWIGAQQISANPYKYITGTTSIIAPTWATQIEVDWCWAGGGGGGGSNGAGSAGSGGGGGEFRAGVATVTPGEQIDIFIGGGGANGTNAPTSGSAGGNTIIQHHVGSVVIIECIGGGGGVGATGAVAPTAGQGGTGGSGGQFALAGSNGGTGNAFAGQVFYGVGGFSFMGTFGGAGSSNSGVSGNPGVSFGCGGSGGIIGGVGGVGGGGAVKYRWLP